MQIKGYIPSQRWSKKPSAYRLNMNRSVIRILNLDLIEKILEDARNIDQLEIDKFVYYLYGWE